MVVTTLVTLFIFYLRLGLSHGTENITVQEIDGLLYVTELTHSGLPGMCSYGPLAYKEMLTN
jgi:hypothetical protein